MAISLNTEDKLEYKFYPCATGHIQFRVKTANDAHIALTTGPAETDPMLEVFIGGWGNSKSVIRKNRSKPDVAEVPTPEILSDAEFRGFWIRWRDGLVTVGKEGEVDPLLSYSDPDPFAIGYFGICTGWGATGEWMIEESAGAPPAQIAQGDIGNACWCDAAGGMVPPGALEGGMDEETLYVGRAYHEGALIPGKVKPGHSVCYVAWGGEEHGKTDYQVLCGPCNTKWEQTSGANVPANAVPGGETENGEPLFIGRVNHEGTVTIGKVQPSHSVCYIPFAGAEVAFPEYEILVSQ